MTEINPLEIIDTHAHLDMSDFDPDRDRLLARSRAGEFPPIRGKTIESGPVRFKVGGMVLPGITAASSQLVADLAALVPEFYPGAGIHPNHLLEIKPGDWDTIRRLAARPETVAIGETGLDLHWQASPIELQLDYLIRHSLLAKEKGLPIIIHCRDAEEDLLRYAELFRRWEEGDPIPHLAGFDPLFEPESAQLLNFPPMRGVIHSYSGGPDTALKLIHHGFCLGFTGSVTFGKKFAPIAEAAKAVPADRILLETDSPFLVPHPFRGKLERNEPLMSAWTARCLAQLRGVSIAEIISLTAANARRLFSLP